MRKYLRRSILAALLACVVLCAPGCGLPNLLVFPWAPRDATEDVKAEYHLTAERLLILPYLADDVEFEQPGAGGEIAYEIIGQIDKNLRGRVHRVVRPPQVTRYQQSTLDWQSMSPAAIGREFKADKVLYLELHRFSIMEERSANLYRGRLAGRIQVIDTAAAPGKETVYEGDVAVEVPDDKPIGAMEIREDQLRWAAIHRFAEEIIWKFCDHEEKRMEGSL